MISPIIHSVSSSGKGSTSRFVMSNRLYFCRFCCASSVSCSPCSLPLPSYQRLNSSSSSSSSSSPCSDTSKSLEPSSFPSASSSSLRASVTRPPLPCDSMASRTIFHESEPVELTSTRPTNFSYSLKSRLSSPTTLLYSSTPSTSRFTFPVLLPLSSSASTTHLSRLSCDLSGISCPSSFDNFPTSSPSPSKVFSSGSLLAGSISWTS
mmetsp:Transcript_19190/g.63386  ORF Transcript_19190/g.63386 Transcript_19190/m.63386 type:complete len:208 (+) Transcript_19190:851-1474(+)